MAYDRDDILESEVAYEICSLLWEEVAYGAEIGDRLDGEAEHKAESVRNLLREMKKAGILSIVDDDSLKIMNEDGNLKKDISKGNFKYYTVDIEGMYNYWFEEMRKKLKDRLIQSGIAEHKLEDREKINQLIKELKDAADDFEKDGELKPHGKAYHEIKSLQHIIWTYDMTPEHGGKLKPFFRNYATTYLNSISEGNFRRMLFEDISAGINSSKISNKDEELRNKNPELYKLSEVLTTLIGNPTGIRAAESAINNTLNDY